MPYRLNFNFNSRVIYNVRVFLSHGKVLFFGELLIKKVEPRCALHVRLIMYRLRFSTNSYLRKRGEFPLLLVFCLHVKERPSQFELPSLRKLQINFIIKKKKKCEVNFLTPLEPSSQFV